MTVPTFVIAGTQKAATTWLYECLVEHPNVSLSRTKELHFFCDENKCPKSSWPKGHDWYFGNFPGTRVGASVIGEASVDYMYYEVSPKRLFDVNPDMKVIFILRDPIDRAYSAYWMRRRARTDYPGFGEFIDAESDLVRRGFYYEQIQRYRQYFPDNQLKVMIYEEIDTPPRAFLEEVFSFLEIEQKFWPASAGQLIGETKLMNPSVSALFYRYGAKILRIRLALAGWRLFKRVSGYKRKVERGGGGSKYPSMNADDRRKLNGLFQKETSRLYEFLGRRIAAWSIE